MRAVVRIVRSRLEPPAPYVTDTNAGSSGSRRRMARHSSASPASSFGGKNSTENTGRSPLIRWVTFTQWSVVNASPVPVSLRDPWLRRLAGLVTRGYARPRGPLDATPAPPPPTRGVVLVSRAGAVHHPPPGPGAGDGGKPADS